jgi:hypothetical protein
MHTDILSEKDRRALCEFLAEKATDEDILAAVKQTKDRFLFIQDELNDVKKFVGSNRFSQTKSAVESVTEEKTDPIPAKVKSTPVVPEVSSSPNVEPPGVASKRVRGGTRDTIIRLLTSKPHTAGQINAGVNGVQNNTDAVLKLLWSRKEIKFNGSTFYV